MRLTADRFEASDSQVNRLAVLFVIPDSDRVADRLADANPVRVVSAVGLKLLSTVDFGPLRRKRRPESG